VCQARLLFPCAVTSLARAVNFFRRAISLSGHFPGAQTIFLFLFCCRSARHFSFRSLSAGLCSVRSLPWRAHCFCFFSCCRSTDSSVCQRHFFVRSPPWRADFLLAAAQQDSRTCARQNFFCVESGLVCMQNLFFLHAASGHFPSCRARRFFVLLALHEDMRVENLLFGQQQGCTCRFFLFVLSGHLFSAQRAQLFLDISALPAH
jgi:hypothetical protein